MGNYLAIDTSTHALSVALSCEGKEYFKHEVVPREHGKLILPWIEELLALADIERTQLDAVFVGVGPGGFTSVRIGVGVAQGIAAALNLPLIGVSSLQIIGQYAVDFYQIEEVIVIQDAFMGEVYFGAYKKGEVGLVKSLVPDQLCKPDQVVIPLSGKNSVVVGDAWKTYSEILTQRFEGFALEVKGECYPHASSLLKLGSQLISMGEVTKPEQVLPVYLRGESAWKKMDRDFASPLVGEAAHIKPIVPDPDLGAGEG